VRQLRIEFIAGSSSLLGMDAFNFTPAGGCPGDLNGDQRVDQRDLGILLADYGCDRGPGNCPGDADGDGDTDQADLGVLLANYGRTCE
jgi:hypothetical protein